MKTRTSLCLALCAALAPMLSGCGGAEADEASAREAAEAAAMKRAVQQASETNAARVKLERAKAAAKAAP